MAGEYRRLILADLPALYWPLDATYGATDQSGNARNGTGTGSLSPGGFSGSPISGETTSTDFNGSSQAATSTYTTTSVRTMEVWFNRDTSNTDDIIFGTSAGFGTANFLRPARDAEGNTDVQLWIGGTSYTWSAALPASSGSWIHLVVTVNETTDLGELYINGTSRGTKAVTANSSASVGTFQIGRYSTGSDYFDGKMYGAAVYERALTASEIQGHYRVGIETLPLGKFTHEAGRGQ